MPLAATESTGRAEKEPARRWRPVVDASQLRVVCLQSALCHTTLPAMCRPVLLLLLLQFLADSAVAGC